MSQIRTYSELKQYETFEERYYYLRLVGIVGESTFGFDRWINQGFYTSREWKQARSVVILRDHGCDLGVFGYEIFEGLLVHHMNPISVKDIEAGRELLIDPEFLITTTHQTHNAIHYGDESQLSKVYVPRKAGDTKLW
jgi:hypothetical protein